MSNEKMREEFEDWFIRHTDNNGGVAFYVDINGKYCFTDIELAWQAWQASREALCVDLPLEFGNGMYRADHTQEVLDKAGVKYK